MEFILGQKVRVVKDETRPELKDKVGYIIVADPNKPFYGVEFDEYINGHDCGFVGTHGCCWYFAKHNLEAVSECQGQLSKFKNAYELQKAYLELEKEFSRRNQAYKELAEEHDRFVEEYNEKIDELNEEITKRDNEILKNIDFEALTKAITVIGREIKDISKVVIEFLFKVLEERQIHAKTGEKN